MTDGRLSTTFRTEEDIPLWKAIHGHTQRFPFTCNISSIKIESSGVVLTPQEINSLRVSWLKLVDGDILTLSYSH